MRDLSLGVLLTVALTPALAAAPSPAIARKPNIVLIYADDLGYGDLGCYGQQRFATPNIDRLAAEGLRFTQHYSSAPVCAPARASLLTGRHSGRSPIRGNTEYLPEGQAPLPGDSVTIASLLRRGGYATGAFGKWGLGFVHTEGDPNRQGFDRFFGYNCQRWAHRAYPPYLWDNGTWHFLPGNDMSHTVTYAPDVIHERALEFIREQRDKPFFLFVATTLPHAELLVPDDEILAQFDGKFPEQPHAGSNAKPPRTAAYGPLAQPGGYAPQPRPHATFAATVTRLDRHVGDILRVLKELNLDEDTIVLFSSDNGPHQEGGGDPVFFNSNGGLRGTKRDLYEGGIRVPLLARWPGRIEAGKTTTHPCAGWDFMATLAEIAGVPLAEPTDGISFAPTLLGRAEQKTHDALYWEFAERGGEQAVRFGDWKLVRIFASPKRPASLELFNLHEDSAETRNLAEKHPDLVQRGLALMQQRHEPHPVFRLPID